MARQSLSTILRGAAAATVVAGAVLAGPAGARASSTAPHVAPTSRVDVAATDPRFGIDEAAAQPEVANTLGARWSRIPFIWNYVEPTAPAGPISLASPSWPAAWNRYVLSSRGSDTIVNGEVARNRSIVGLLLGTPAWARQNVAWGQASVPKNIDLPWNDPNNYWGTYCYKMAQHFAGRIDEWVIWNEVSIPANANGSAGFWTQWRGTPAQYARLLEVSYQAIKSANPHARVVMYGDPYWYDYGAYLSHMYDLLAQANPVRDYHDPVGPYNQDHQGYFDVANLHLYIGTPSFYWIIGDLRKQLRQHGWGDKQVWVSETNVEPFNDPYHDATRKPAQFRVTMQEQAGFLVDAFATYIAAKADRFAIYRMFDGPDTAHGLAPLGIVNNGGTERPFGYTFQFLVKLFKNATTHVDNTRTHADPAYVAGDLYPMVNSSGQPFVVNGTTLYKAGVFKVVCDKPGQRISVLWNQMGALNKAVEPHYTQVTYPDGSRHYNIVNGLRHDAKDMIVLPLADAAGVHYDINATATYTMRAHATQATIYDKYGHATTIHNGETRTVDNVDVNGAPLSYVTPGTQTTVTLAHGLYTLRLRGGHTYTNPSDPRIPTAGGDPVVVVEATGSGANS